MMTDGENRELFLRIGFSYVSMNSLLEFVVLTCLRSVLVRKFYTEKVGIFQICQK